MAFMMPVIKNNYNLYAQPGNPKQQRRTSDQTDLVGRTSNPTIPGLSVRLADNPRRVRSEGTSLNASPAISYVPRTTAQAQQQRSSKPIEVKRGRGSVPSSTIPSSMIQQPSAGGMMMAQKIRPSSSLPSGANNGVDQDSPTRSITSSSSSENSGGRGGGSSSGGGVRKFHSKLVSKLRKTFRIKDPAESNNS